MQQLLDVLALAEFVLAVGIIVQVRMRFPPSLGLILPLDIASAFRLFCIPTIA